MKHLLLMACLLASLVSARAQFAPGPQPALRVAGNTLFLDRVSVMSFSGRTYRLTMRARADTTDGSWASLGIVYVQQRRLRGSADLYSQRPLNRVHGPQWQTYTITGKLLGGTDTVALTPNVSGNGRFAFDDFRLELRGADGNWERLRIPNGDFVAATLADTADSHLPPAGWRSVAKVGYTYRVAAEPSGNHYLLLQGTGIVPYGHNRRAGHYQLANGVRLYYETYGQGQPLLLLHGNGEDIASWRYQIADLAQHYRVMAVDTRDHGQSAATKGALTYDLFAQDMLALLDSLRVPAAHVLGWSDGGNTGLSLALHHPERVRSLITMGANLFADSSAVEGRLLTQVQQARHHGPARVRRLNALMADYPRMAPAELAGLRVPTLVLAGEKDVIKEAHTRLIASSIPGAELRILPGVTHYAPQEKPEEFNQAVLEFLARHSR